ncbi:neuronal growth regulator 1-like [Panulirus ornatus]|uniref:neuronal growth regulator 1-like n=1 Tax=Panulirus ornatus TaxID=150431 RepID=UPI003A882CFA
MSHKLKEEDEDYTELTRIMDVPTMLVLILYFLIPSAWCAILNEDEASSHQPHKHNSLPPFVDILPPGPFYDVERSANVTALVDRPAKLNCRVNKIGNRTVSWLRHRDTHLLTVGPYTYTSDQRFRAVHTAGSEDWGLTIKFAQVRDSGMYECQVSTTPPMRHYIWLTVVEPKTTISGGSDVFINKGSNINLTCVVDYTVQPPSFVIWSHNNKQFRLRIQGEHPEAMQHGGHSPYEVSTLLVASALTLIAALK